MTLASAGAEAVTRLGDGSVASGVPAQLRSMSMLLPHKAEREGETKWSSVA